MNLDSRIVDSIDFKNRLQLQGSYDFAGRQWSASDLIKNLEPFLTPERIQRIDSVLPFRSKKIAVVAEHLYDIGNISAVMRSAESFGFLPFHIIEKQGSKYKKSDRVSKGSEKWLDIYRWKDTASGLQDLKKQGYQIVVTAIGSQSRPLSEVDFSIPTAIVLGNEKDGVSEKAIELADIQAMIPMNGLTQSFNISVAAAILFYHAFLDRLKRTGQSGDLSKDEIEHIRAQYYLRTLDSAEDILKSIVQKS